jgi:hypothetical protein
MSELYRIAYDNIAWRAGLNSITDTAGEASGTSATAAGFGVENAFDGDRNSIFRVDSDNTGGFEVVIDRGSAYETISTWVPCLGLINHNLDTAGIETITLEVSTDDVSYTTWLTVVAADVTDDDLIFQFDAGYFSMDKRYAKVAFDFGSSGPAVDVDIGQIYVGDYLAFSEPPQSEAATPIRMHAAITPTAAGSRAVRSKGTRSQVLALMFDNVPESVVVELLNVADLQEGPLRPFLLHTHRHDGAATAWTAVTGNTSRGGCYMVSLLTDTIKMTELTDGIYRAFDFSVHRQMGPGET